MEVFPKHNSIPYFQSSVSHSQGYISESLNDSFEASPTKLKVVGKCPPLLSRFGVHCAMFSKTPTRLQELPISNSLYFLDPHLGQRIKSYKIDDWAFHVNVFICVSHLTLVSGVYQSSYPSWNFSLTSWQGLPSLPLIIRTSGNFVCLDTSVC